MTTLIDLAARAPGVPAARTSSGSIVTCDRPSTTPTSMTTRRREAGADLHELPEGSDRCVAPSRFDVHQIDPFERWVAATIVSGASRLVVDCSSVDFIDLAALESIAQLGSKHSLEVVGRSVAYRITSQLVGAVGTELAEAA